MARRGKEADTGDYSATKAPENREHVESKWQSNHSSLKPGGPRDAPTDVGMSSLDPDTTGNPTAAGEKSPHDHISERHNRPPEAGTT
jgi:hypothetical protein